MRLSCDDLPMFFDASHGALAERLREAAEPLRSVEISATYADEAARDKAAALALAQTGLFELVAPADGKIDSRSLCLAREMLGYVSPRADSIFAVQGLGTFALASTGRDVSAFARGERGA